jgi:ascorbate-specific PTS system EIIC-type component UlaA
MYVNSVVLGFTLSVINAVIVVAVLYAIDQKKNKAANDEKKL